MVLSLEGNQGFVFKLPEDKHTACTERGPRHLKTQRLCDALVLRGRGIERRRDLGDLRYVGTRRRRFACSGLCLSPTECAGTTFVFVISLEIGFAAFGNILLELMESPVSILQSHSTLDQPTESLKAFFETYPEASPTPEDKACFLLIAPRPGQKPV